MTEQPIDSGLVPFRADSRLLQELGERLVASPSVALVELIKNAYDADATECHVSVDDQASTLTIRDTGSGMTLDDFLNRWMTIATDSKRASQISSKFHRPLTGAKGIGRFAVRFLGQTLELTSTAIDSKRRHKTRLVASFNWPVIDQAPELSKVEIPYSLYREDDPSAITGTSLRIGSLRGGTTVVFGREVRTQVLRLTSPLVGLEMGPFASHAGGKGDPGFAVLLPDESSLGREEDLAKQVLNNYGARLVIKLHGRKLCFEVFFPGDTKARYAHPANGSHSYRSRLSNGLFADIRFFPRRPGIFSAKEFDGRTAWKWVRENCGVSVVDRGFRVKPYGFADDDWLLLDSDNARNYRNWRSQLMKDQYPIPEEHKNTPSMNPLFNLPQNLQLVGAVAVESNQIALDSEDLIPSMDREGFIDNQAFRDMWEVVRAGIEFLALADEKEQQEKLAKKAREAQAHARQDFKAAIEYIRSSPTLNKVDKDRITTQYAALAEQVEEVDSYHRQARESLEAMSLLGVIAGFMTHESRRIVWSLGEVVKGLESIARRQPAIRESLLQAEDALRDFKAHLEYSSTFIGAVHSRATSAFNARTQVARIIRLFKGFADQRGIQVKNEVPDDVDTPSLPVSVYSGILLNLYTNALKAVVATKTNSPTHLITFRGWNEPTRHVIEVLDNGIGIPPNLRERIFDPLFTTTSTLNSPLGSGMGIGLSLVRKLMKDLGGTIKLVDAPTTFSTCFKLEFPIERK